MTASSARVCGDEAVDEALDLLVALGIVGADQLVPALAARLVAELLHGDEARQRLLHALVDRAGRLGALFGGKLVEAGTLDEASRRGACSCAVQTEMMPRSEFR